MKKLGLLAPKNAPAIQLKAILSGIIPTHPVIVDHFAQVGDWGMYANDKYGVCGPTSVANSRKLTTKYLGDFEVSPTQADVFDLYRRSGNPHFDPQTGADDNGVIMQTMLEALQKGGIGGEKCVAFAQVDPSNLDEIRAAIAIFGFVLQGVNLMQAQQAQTDNGLWGFVPSAPWGGHAILAGKYTSQAGPVADLAVITWAHVVGETDEFLARQLSECWVVIWPEHLGTRQFQTGVDRAALASAYTALTGRPLPLPAPPSPTPPSPTPPPLPGGGNIQQQIDDVFAQLEARFASRPLVLRIIKAVHAWVDAYLQHHPGAIGPLASQQTLSPAQLKAILDQIFAALEATLSPPWSVYVAIVQALVDALLGTLPS